ncbi:MAG: hypothetical protein WBZ36_12280 [Candidatus Nitrosopolaris sp.]
MVNDCVGDETLNHIISQWVAMSAITVCCPSMETMIKDGTIVPFTTWGQNTGQMFVRGRNNKIFDYNSVIYCPFCATQIHLQDKATA